MVNFCLRRAVLSLQIFKTSRTFGVSFSTSLSGRGKPRPRQLGSDVPYNPFRSHIQEASQRSNRSTHARTASTSTRLHQELPTDNATIPEPSLSTAAPPTSLENGFMDQPVILDEGDRQVDWTRSFHGLSTAAFSPEATETLLAPIDPDDIEVKPDGIIYLPEIKYRRILNKAFGPGAWGLAPRGETIVTPKSVTREYALVALGRLVSVARGEQDYFSPEGIPTAAEGCKSNAMMRCCKDLGVASEMWDPRFIRNFLKEYTKEIFVEHQVTKKRKKIWMRKDDVIKYPFKEAKYYAS